MQSEHEVDTMDKYEYRLKTDQMKKLADKKDTFSAIKVADTIDWRKVRDVKTLTSAAEVYVANGRYDTAIDLLLQAYEYAPIGRRIMYRLTEIAIEAGNFQDARSYYEEFQEIAPHDLGQYILRYQLEKAKGAPVEELIQILEEYRVQDFDERWSYELAELYHKAGRREDCVKLCDDIILWFSLGKYVEKAMKLKMVYEPLTASQKEKAENQTKYAEKLRKIQEASEFTGRKEDAAPAAPANQAAEEAAEESVRVWAEREEEVATAKTVGELEVVKAEPARQETVQEEQEPVVRMPKPPVFAREPVKEETVAAPAQNRQNRDTEHTFLDVKLEPYTHQFLDGAGEKIHVKSLDEEMQRSESETTSQAVSREDLGAASLKQSTTWVKEAGEEARAAILEGFEAEPQVTVEGAGIAEEPVYRNDSDTLHDFEENIRSTLKKIASEPEAADEVKVPAVESEPKERSTGSVEAAEKTYERSRTQLKSWNFLVTARDEQAGFDLAVAKLKSMPKEETGRPSKVARIDGEKLNKRGILAVLDKLRDKVLIVDHAGKLLDSILEELEKVVNDPEINIMVVLIDTPKEIDNLMNYSVLLSSRFPNRYDCDAVTADELAEYALQYADEQECVLDDVAVLALYVKIDEIMQNPDGQEKEHIQEIMDEAIDRAEHRGGLFRGLFGNKLDEQGRLVLKEDHFK